MSFALSQDDVKGLNDDQKIAIIDALVTAAWADGTVSQSEKDRFESEMVKLPWGKEPAQLIEMVHTSVGKVVQLKDKDSVLKFIAGIAEKLPDPAIREKVLYTMGTIMYSDRDLSTPEKNVIAAFSEAFKLPRDRIEAIGKEVRLS